MPFVDVSHLSWTLMWNKKGQINCKRQTKNPTRQMRKTCLYLLCCISKVFTDVGTTPTCSGLCAYIYMDGFFNFYFNYFNFFFLQSYGLVLFYRSCPGAAIWNKNVCIHFLINRLIVIQPAAAKWQNRCNDEN